MILQRGRKELERRVAVLDAVGLVALAFIAASYWLAQVVRGAEYRELADNNRLRQIVLEAPRGLIVDREERTLVENVPSYTLRLDRTLSRDLGESLDFAEEILGLESGSLEAVVEQSRSAPRFRSIRLAEDLSLAEVARFGVQALEHPEFEVGVEHFRLYRHAHRTAHVLGYLGEVTEADLAREDRDYRPGELVGRKGVEARWDDLLRGEDGRQIVVVDSRGRQVGEYHSEPALPGQNLRLTLDLALQQEAARQLEGKVGAVVALDPRQGDVLALVSAPSFDPNPFARRLDRKQWQSLISNPDHPLQNRTIQNTYPPGSVFKIPMALAALEAGVVGPSETVFCGGAAKFYGHRRRCWKRQGHGRVDLEASLRDSCDIYYYQAGQKLGIEAIGAFSRRLGFGRPTGIELSGEKGGLVPGEEWSRRVRGTAWYAGETISVAIGQGPILVTPLQVATMLGAVANGGTLFKPRLTFHEEPRGEHVALDAGDLELVRGALWSVVNDREGTGRNSRIDGLDVAGKTGTAQVVAQETWTKNEELPPELRDHAWFASWAPLDDPRLVVVVFVEHGGGGSTAAAPIARAIHARHFGIDLDTGA